MLQRIQSILDDSRSIPKHLHARSDINTFVAYSPTSIFMDVCIYACAALNRVFKILQLLTLEVHICFDNGGSVYLLWCFVAGSRVAVRHEKHNSCHPEDCGVPFTG